MLVALKGALPAPQRTVDTSLLASWLTLRAVEQQSQQIDAMEQAAPGERRRRLPRATLAGRPALRPSDTAPAAAEPRRMPTRASPDQAPPLPPPVDVPAIPQPAGTPRAESAPPRAPSAPARAVVRPPGLVGAQN